MTKTLSALGLLAALLLVVQRPCFSAGSESWQAPESPVIKRQAIEFWNAGTQLRGTLYWPVMAKARRVPVVVAFHDASVGMADAPLYRHLREGLPAMGIGVLLFDRRGSGKSGGSAKNVSYAMLADDGIAGARAISTLSQIDPRHIGYWGLSQGGWLAILAANRDKHAAFAVSVSAPLVTPEVQMEFAMANRLRVLGCSQSDVSAMLDARRSWSAYLAGRGTRAAAIAKLSAIYRKPWFSQMYLPSPDQVPSDPRASSWRTHMNVDPLPALDAVRMPMLFIFGGADPWIPVDVTVRRLNALSSRHPNLQWNIVPNASHEMMFVSPSRAMSTDTNTDQVFPEAPQYFMLLASWLTRHAF